MMPSSSEKFSKQDGNEYDAKIRAGDKHTPPLGKNDKIWGGMKYEESGCRAFVEWYLKIGSDVILETNHLLKESMDFLNFLLKTYI